jgi:hypothetical protein
MLFKAPVGPLMMSIEDFIIVPMVTLSFLSHQIEANQTIIV